jgi:predicted nucleic acid-binding protein
VPDTTAFVAAVRQGDTAFLEAVTLGRIWLCTVVACELYAGTRSPTEAQLLDQLVRGAERAGKLLVPTEDDWIAAGRLLSRRSRLVGAVRPRDHLADVLIVLTAARIGGEILTANLAHLDVWVDLARRGGLDVAVQRSPPTRG